MKGKQVINTNISGKTYVITGATSGIGLAAAEALVRQGAFVIGVGRTAERCQEAEGRLRTILQGMAHDLKAEAGAEYCLADLAQQSQVRALATEIGCILAGCGKSGLDGLINNAGTFTYWLSLTSEGYETQWAVNHLAPFLLTRLLLPLLQASPAARVVTVSSGAHYGVRLNWEDIQLRRHYNGLRAYAQTKLANILFTLEFNRRLESGSSLRAFAVDPGLVKTDIGLKGTPTLVRWVWWLRRSSGITAEEAAKWIVSLATQDLKAQAGTAQLGTDIYWKFGLSQKASPYALDRESAARLWALSEQMCGLAAEDEHDNEIDIPGK